MQRKTFNLVLAIGVSCLTGVTTNAQVGINTNGGAPAASAMLDVDASALPANGKRGLLLPRMTAGEREAIPAPATGLLVYETTTNAYWYFNGTLWMQLFGSYTDWQFPGNTGIVPGTHFLGTNTAVPLEFRRNNMRSAWVSSAGTNTAWGYLALAVNSGTNNTALGSRALAASTTGSRNTAVGSNALANSGSSNSVAVGANALRVGTSVIAQTAVGARAMENYTSGAGNTAVGSNALLVATPTNCTAVGQIALQYSTGANNTVFGNQTMIANTNGSGNTAFGSLALSSLASGSNNTLIGRMNYFTSGSDNTSVGAFYYLTSGTGNCGIGGGGGDNTGNYNTLMGSGSHLDNDDGAYGTALGAGTLGYMPNTPSSTDFCTAAGYVAFTGITANNMTAIGYNAMAPGGNVIRFGNAANNTGLIGGFGAWQNLSDARYKKNVRENVPGLDFILRLRPVTYRFDVNAYDTFTGLADHMTPERSSEELATYTTHANASSDIRRIGFIAQEVESAAESLGFEFSGVHRPMDDKDHYTIGYEQFVVPLVKAVQEQQEQLDTMLVELNAAMLRVELLSADIREGVTLPAMPPRTSANSQRP